MTSSSILSRHIQLIKVTVSDLHLLVTMPRVATMTSLRPTLTSLDPDVLAELGGHAHQEGLTLSRDSLMEVVATATDNLKRV